MMWGYGWEWGWPMGLWMGLVVLFWLGVLGLLVWGLVRLLSHRAPMSNIPRGPELSAMEILRQRYARGEIDVTTYEQMRERLEATQAPTIEDSERYRSPTTT